MDSVMSELLVIGCGLAGLSAAIKAAENNQHVTLVSPLEPERAQSVMAMGGTNAALDTKGQSDSPEQHFTDTMVGGCNLGNPKAVKKMTAAAPDTIRWLSKIGVNFTRDENGNPDLRYFGGQKKKRTAYAGARTGKQLITALAAKERMYESAGLITKKIGLRFISLVKDESDSCVGAVFFNIIKETFCVFSADAVVLAFGAPNGVFGKTTGSVVNDGCASGLAFQEGLVFANLEMIQFHPTTISTHNKRMLITEAARGLGGRLYANRNGEKWYFMEEWYPERGALMPRDVVSRSIYRVCNEFGLKNNGKNEVFLDITQLSAKVIERDLDEVLETCLKYLNLDPRKEPIPVYPGVHYFMGGILTDECHRTNIKRVYAAGECSCQYHGANRLGGNSTLGAVYGGLICAEEGAKESTYEDADKKNRLCNAALEKEQKKFDAWKNESNKYRQTNTSVNNGSIAAKEKMVELMNNNMGIFRNGNDLEQTYKELEILHKKIKDQYACENYYDYVSTNAILLIAQAMVASALARKESRGSHQRIDFPQTNDAEFKKNTLAKLSANKIQIELGEIC